MRKWFASLAVLGLASVASAQTMPVPSVGGCGQSQSLFFDDGHPETSWKVSYPTGAGDAFNVDFDDMAGTMDVLGVALNTFQSTSTGPLGIRYIAICPDNLGLDSTGHTPDLGAAYSMLGTLSGTVQITGNPNGTAGYCPGLVGYDLPDATIPSTGGMHAVTTCVTGDTGTWLCSDQTASAHRSFFTINSYSTPALGFSANLQVRPIVSYTPSNGSAYMTINNSASATSISQTGQLTATLWSSCATQPTLYLQGAFITGYPFIPAPALVLATGLENFSTISDPFQGTICGPLSDPSSGPCVPAGITFGVGAFYLDNCDLKPNGHPKVKLTNQVKVTVTPDLAACNPCACWGQYDDGAASSFWKVTNPATSNDYFNVRFGSFVDPNSGGNCAKGISDFQVATYDQCGGGGPLNWQDIGLYPANTALDSTGNTPDVANPVVQATGLTASAGVLDFSYPASTYDFPDVAASTNGALATYAGGSVAVHWVGGDTCLWIGGDTNGTDDDSTSTGTCSQIPSTRTYFTINGYSTPAIRASYANWMMKVDTF